MDSVGRFLIRLWEVRKNAFKHQLPGSFYVIRSGDQVWRSDRRDFEAESLRGISHKADQSHERSLAEECFTGRPLLEDTLRELASQGGIIQVARCWVLSTLAGQRMPILLTVTFFQALLILTRPRQTHNVLQHKHRLHRSIPISIVVCQLKMYPRLQGMRKGVIARLKRRTMKYQHNPIQ